jgi:hypothetical protein
MMTTSDAWNCTCEWKVQSIACFSRQSSTEAPSAMLMLVIRASTTAASTIVNEVMSSTFDGAVCDSATPSTPAMPLNAPATFHGSLVSLTTSTPRVAARSRLSAVARLSRPRRPIRNRQMTAASARTASATDRTS